MIQAGRHDDFWMEHVARALGWWRALLAAGAWSLGTQTLLRA